MRIDCSRISENDLFGRYFLKKPNGIKFDNYYNTIVELRSLFDSEDWNKYVTGYYINVADDMMNAVRLSYFTADAAKVSKCKDNFCSSNNIVESHPPILPDETRISKGYGNEELRFRKFLHMYTLIGLDLLKADLLNARCLFATFRFQVMHSRQAYKPHFEGTFEKHSQIYLSLTDEDKKQFWDDLSKRPNPPDEAWAHMMVNMILPGDFLSQRSIIAVEEINKIIATINFQIPNGWVPIKKRIT